MADDRKAIIDAYGASSEFWLKKNRVSERFLALIRSYLTKDMSVLDLGCGGGRMAFLLAEDTARIVGCDISKELIEGARAKAESSGQRAMSFLQGDLEDAVTWTSCVDVNSGSLFDMAVSNVLFRKDACRIDVALRSCRNAVRHGGHLLFRIESDDDLPELRCELPCYSLAEVRSVLGSQHFEVLSLEEERFSQRFSSSDFFMEFLDRTGLSHHLRCTDQLETAEARARSIVGKDGLRATRRYIIVHAAIS